MDLDTREALKLHESMQRLVKLRDAKAAIERLFQARPHLSYTDAELSKAHSIADMQIRALEKRLAGPFQPSTHQCNILADWN